MSILVHRRLPLEGRWGQRRGRPVLSGVHVDDFKGIWIVKGTTRVVVELRLIRRNGKEIEVGRKGTVVVGNMPCEFKEVVGPLCFSRSTGWTIQIGVSMAHSIYLSGPITVFNLACYVKNSVGDGRQQEKNGIVYCEIRASRMGNSCHESRS